MLKIKFLGEVRIERNGIDITKDFGAKALALLSLMFLKKKVSRGNLIDYLWPNSNEDSGKYNLRFNLWKIKNIIGKDVNGNKLLEIERKDCLLNYNYRFYCDIDEIKSINTFQNYLTNDLEKIRKELSGDFMKGFYFKDCNKYNDIIISERNFFETQKGKILLKLVNIYEEEKKFILCSEILREFMDFEPYDEDIALRIMEIYEKVGKRSSAILFFNKFKKKLIVSLGIQPSKNLQLKYLKLKEENIILEEKEDNWKTLKFKICSIKGVKFHWISKFLEEMSKKLDINLYLTEEEVKDLLYVCPKINEKLRMNSPPDVRIVNTIVTLIEKLSKEVIIIAEIDSSENIDEFSRATLDYLLKRELMQVIEIK